MGGRERGWGEEVSGCDKRRSADNAGVGRRLRAQSRERREGGRGVRTDELLERLELLVRLAQQRLLVLALPQGGQRSGFVALCECLLGNLALAREHTLDLDNERGESAGFRGDVRGRDVVADPLLVLLELVPLQLQAWEGARFGSGVSFPSGSPRRRKRGVDSLEHGTVMWCDLHFRLAGSHRVS